MSFEPYDNGIQAVSDVQLKVVVKDDFPELTKKLEKELIALGLAVEGVVPEIGVIYGTADDASIDAIKNLEGVEEVSLEDVFEGPPFDPSIPQ